MRLSLRRAAHVSSLAARSRKSGYAPVLNEQTSKVEGRRLLEG
jgi:hypothetical protein